MTGDVLMPVLITFLVVNVVLLVRAWAKGELGRTRALVAGRPQQVSRAAGPDAPVRAVPETPVAPALAATEAPAAAPAVVEEPAPTAPDATKSPSETETETETAGGPALVARRGDPLPGLDDEAAWDRRVADENVRLVRYRRPVTIVRLELDGLDRLVGLLDDEAGDRLLRAMADTLRRLARDTDHVACLGYGSFAVLMPETPDDAAVQYVARVSRACELWLEAGAVAVRLRIGWASTSGGIALADVQRLATERMHHGPWPETRRTPTTAAAVVTAAQAPVAQAPVAPVPAVQAPATHAPAAAPIPAAQAPAARGTTRRLVTDAPPELAASRSWETCRVPGCNHKEDHRRDRRP